MNPRMLRVCVLLCSGALTGCLLPQDITYLPEPLVFRNRPPVILDAVPGKVTPTNRKVCVINAPAPQTITFHVAVADQDLADQITIAWFVDYPPNFDPNNPPPTAFAYRTFIIPGSTTNADVERNTGFADLTMSLDNPINPLNGRANHIVEALVSDGVLRGRASDPKLVNLPDGGTATDPTFVVSYAWTVWQAGGAPSCP